jgi:hypothetical protein
MGIIREPEGVDFVVDPREFTEEERLNVLAFIAACKDRKKEEQKQIDKRKRSYKKIVAAL